MINAGIIGFGGMGHVHFGVYEESEDANLVAVADTDEEKLGIGNNTQNINIGEGAATLDPKRHSLYSNPPELLDDDNVELVDICLPTYLHADYVIQALEAGKHVLCEKPMAFTSRECERMLEATDNSPGYLMIAQCIRFWPGWLLDSSRSGGALLDLHVHDVDYVQNLLGQPASVFSTGTVGPTGGYDMVDTLYRYDDESNDRISVHTGCAWELPAALGFEMKYSVAFEGGAITFSSKDSPTLTEYRDEDTIHPDVPDTDGYHREIEYFIRCIENDEPPRRCSPESTASSVQIARAEEESARTGQIVLL
ncbi:MAG: Gfo/Idh/MocA family protein [Planctomycetota bacterium]